MAMPGISTFACTRISLAPAGFQHFRRRCSGILHERGFVVTVRHVDVQRWECPRHLLGRGQSRCNCPTRERFAESSQPNLIPAFFDGLLERGSVPFGTEVEFGPSSALIAIATDELGLFFA